MAVSLVLFAMGLMFSYIFYQVEPQPWKMLNAILFERVTASRGDWGNCVVLVTLLAEAALLTVAAQTGFIDGPRILSNMALDRWLPTRFATLSDRLLT